MAYASTNFKTKKALKEAVNHGERVTVYNPSGMFDTPREGRAFIEGPWYPRPHSWYAQVELRDGVIVKVTR